ncbi:tudor domain-containing protein qin [Aphomia sociella]
MDTNIQKYCPNCSQLYTLVQTPQKGNNLPLFLSCGHTMCEKCINNIVKFGEPIECKVCHQDMTIDSNDLSLLTQNKIKLYQLFPINIHMLGEMYSQLLMEKQEEKKTATSVNHFIDIKTLLNSIDNTQGECLECHISTSRMCQQCAIILCDSCFNKTHKNFVIFKSHVLKNIEFEIESNICKTHKDKSLDYYCNDCLKSICIDCMMVGVNSCKNHNTVSIQEINEGLIEDLSNVRPKVDEMFRRLTKTACDVGHLLYNIENKIGSCEFTQMMANIEQHFSKLTSQIQVHKQKLINVIIKYKYAEKDSLIKAKDDIKDAIKKAKSVINTINSSTDPKIFNKINLPVLYDDAQRIVNTPWYLKKDETNGELFKVVLKEDVIDLIADYIHLEGSPCSVYKLYSTSELEDIPPPPPTPVYPPEMGKAFLRISKGWALYVLRCKYVVPRCHSVCQRVQEKEEKTIQKAAPLPTFYKNAPNYRSKSGSVSSLHSVSSESSYRSSARQNDIQRPLVQPVQPFAESQHPKQLQEGAQELIYISHIIDPHNFFVQRSCHQTLVKEMLKDFRNAVSLPKPSLNHVSEGKLYLMYNKPDKMWQRCRVISIDRKDINKTIFHVFCIDFGSTESVTIDKLRLLPPARLQSPYPLAINCSLANCMPKNGNWTNDDSFLIQNIIDNKQAVIHIRHISSTSNYCVKLDCDVTTFEDGISLAHALVFHERAKMINPKLQYPTIPVGVEKPKLFMSNNDLKPKSVEEVYITTVVSPDKFYVRKHHLVEVYDKLSEDLLQEYNFVDNTGAVYLPEIRMVYVVNLDKYQTVAGMGGWARCLVHELPGRGRVRVLLPDTGLLLLVHWTALRRIHPKFTTLKALAIECHLAGVTPLNKKWSTGSVALLQKFEGRVLELHVEDSRNRGSIGVTLYDKDDIENIICINMEMIKHKFAVTFGLFSFNINTAVEDQVYTNKSPIKESTTPKPEKVVILKKNATPKQNIENQDLEAKDKGPMRLGAKILHYTSPSLMYVSLTHQQKVFTELFEKIQNYYSNSKTQGKEDWKVGNHCCTICLQSQTWRRAAIVEIEDSNAKVFYSDFASLEVVPISGLRELTPEFASIGYAALKCHLCGVIPAVGDEWPSLTKEYLKELLDAYKRIFITKCGDLKDKSVPVEIWVYHTTQGGALEPNKSEWRCLNKKIIEQGLGIPDKSQEIPSLDSTVNSDDMVSFLNINGSINEWLQLEPLPKKPFIIKSEHESGQSSPVDFEETEQPEEQASSSKSNTIFVSDWLPPEPFQNKEFTGEPTYIDNDGVIYLHDVTQQDTLDLIRKALDVKFKNPDPKAKYAKWTIGEPCIALFFLDNKFYRGRVLEVNNDTSTCLIHYIDYGNEEQCSFSNLRKSIALYQIPTQAHKCILSRIGPVDSQWDRQTLDYIHKSVVEKHCLVKIVGDKINGLLPIELKYDKLWFNDHLVDFEMAKYTDGSKAVVPKYAVATKSSRKEEAIVFESDSGPDYIVEDEGDTSLHSSQSSLDIKSLEGKDWNKIIEEDEEKRALDGKYVTYTKNTDKHFLCNITIINDMNVLELSIIHNDEANLLYEELYANVQKMGYNLSPLNGIFENKACVALFPEDGQWYRASILQYSEEKNKIKVKYVDYGNIEVISLADVREIPKELAELPPSTVTAKLHGVKLNSEVDVDIVAKEYNNTFIDKGPFKAEVLKHDDSIPLVELRDDDGLLVYEKLIDEGVFLKI